MQLESFSVRFIFIVICKQLKITLLVRICPKVTNTEVVRLLTYHKYLISSQFMGGTR